MRFPSPTLRKVTDTVYIVDNTGSSNIAVCVIDGHALAIDSGQLPDVSAEVITIVERDLACRIELLFNTHYHSDHTFGNQSFSCPILASRLCHITMKACLASHWSAEEIARAKKEDPPLATAWKNLRITFPTMTFDKLMTRDFYGIPVVFRRTGGHTPDSAIAYFPDSRLLCAGDLVFGGAYPTLLAHDGNPDELIGVLKEIMRMNVETIIPGHGEVCSLPAVESAIAYWECLVSSCRDAAAAGISEGDIVTALSAECRLPGVTYDDRKHRRNIASVLAFMNREKNHL